MERKLRNKLVDVNVEGRQVWWCKTHSNSTS